jgi:transposase
LELAGRAAARLAGLLGIAVHPSTVLRLVAAIPGPRASTAPEVLGIDFALRKGHVYGTVLVDMATGDVADLLPDRETATVEAWLKAHPGAAIICRDRAGAYAEGARGGAPDATQVADRWHLWHNLAEYAGKTVARHRCCLKESSPGDAVGLAGQEAAAREQEPAEPGIPGQPAAGCGTEGRLAARTRERYAAIHELL